MRIAILLILAPITSIIKADICFNTFERDTAKSTVIFIGKVVDVLQYKFWYKDDPKTIYTFKVSESFKGLTITESFVSIVSPVDGCCAKLFIKDSVYLIFAYGKDFFYTNDCSISALLSKSGDYVLRLGNSKKHFPPLKLIEKFLYSEKKNNLLIAQKTAMDLEIQSIERWYQNQIFILYPITIVLAISILILLKRLKNSKNQL